MFFKRFYKRLQILFSKGTVEYIKNALKRFRLRLRIIDMLENSTTYYQLCALHELSYHYIHLDIILDAGYSAKDILSAIQAALNLGYKDVPYSEYVPLLERVIRGEEYLTVLENFYDELLINNISLFNEHS